MGRELFLDFFTEHEVPVIRKRRHTFLNMDDENVYVLKEGVVKVSVLMRDGREFNIAYLKGFDLLSMFKDAVVDCKFSSLILVLKLFPIISYDNTYSRIPPSQNVHLIID